jgi:recombination protein RecT
MANITVSKQVKEYLTNPKLGLTERIQQAMTPQKAEIFKTSLLNTVNSTTLWEKVNPLSIIQSALISTTLDLPINQNLGFAYLIPYGSNAQFQIGYKGLIQLAQRTGQYQTISSSEVREGQIVSYDPLKGIEFDWTVTDGEIIGYVGYFRLVNGFEKYHYMTLKDIQAHGKKYSKTYGNGPWKTDFDAMAKKTVLKQLISKFGIMSVEMQDAVLKDQKVVNENGETYEDNPNIIVEEPKDTRSDLLKFIQDEVKTVEALEEVVNECETDEEREAYDKKLVELQGEIITEAI